jgi:hypothetical protein
VSEQQIESVVKVVESGIHGVEDELQVRIHGTAMALEAREVMMGKDGFQDR